MPVKVNVVDNKSPVKTRTVDNSSEIKIRSGENSRADALIQKERKERIAADENLQEQITENKVVPIVEEGTIRKIMLSDGSIYAIFDTGAIRQNAQGVLITGNQIVDEAILQGHLYITEIDDINVAVENVLTQDSSTGEIKKRDADKLLEDIGGASYNMDSEEGILSFKIGKQES